MIDTPNQDQTGNHSFDGTDSAGKSPRSTGRTYEIHIKGQLGSQWSDWLEGLEVNSLDETETILSGTIIDQAALLGILNKLNNLNLTLISVNEVDDAGKQFKNGGPK